MSNKFYMKKGKLELVIASLSNVEVFSFALYLQFEKMTSF